MLDRQVRQVDPHPVEGDEIVPFSTCVGARNLIVLGDPGAGKSELFKRWAHASGGKFLSARTFLNTSVERLSREGVLWIDALDESRSSRGDGNAVDSLVRHLDAVQPQGVRLSCRIADWLGKSDLAALAPYFEYNGDPPVVVQLEPLTDTEQEHILTQNGIEGCRIFLEQAKRRGLSALLTNPQTLLMLAKVVGKHEWPNTRTDLFERAANILLHEHNEAHIESRKDVGQYSARELEDAAGALCAVRLVSDCGGFSLRPVTDADDSPSYREISLEPVDLIQAALTRRIFVSAGASDVVDYVHRTIAEFLAARWLAERVRKGLPLGRVQALLGADGHPASSLRGLHGWLAVLGHESTSLLIDADPVGLVTYADAAQLAMNGKRRLMSALYRHAEIDPWFYRGAQASLGIGALSDRSMVDVFREILCSRTAPLSMRMLVVDAQVEGRPLPELSPEMRAILSDSREVYALRDGCLDALCSMGEFGRASVLELFPALGGDENGIRLRVSALCALYGRGLGVNEFAALIQAAVALESDLPIGAMYDFDRIVPDADLPELLDRLDFSSQMPDRGYSHRTTRDLVRIYESLLAKFLRKPSLDDARLHLWLEVLQRYARRYGLNGVLKRTLEECPGVAAKIFDVWLENLDGSDPKFSAWIEFRRIFSDCISEGVILDRLRNALTGRGDRKDAFIYERMLGICLSDPSRYEAVFWLLCEFAERSNRLIEIRDSYCKCEIEQWRVEDANFLARQRDEEAASRVEALAHFDAEQQHILSGEHLGWMGEIANHYFGYFDHEGANSPANRLAEFFGQDRAEVAIAGLRALVERRHAPSLSEVIDSSAKGESYDWWRAILAGLDVLGADIEGLPLSADYLASVIAIACAHPVYSHEANTLEPWRHQWLDYALLNHTEIVRQTYSDMMEKGVALLQRHPTGLSEIRNAALAGPKRGELIAKMLLRYPTMHADVLESLLRLAKEDDLWPQLSHTVAAGVAATSVGESDDCETGRKWLAFGYMIEPDRYQAELSKLSDEVASAMVWPLFEVGSLDRHRDEDFGSYSVAQLEFVVQFAASHFPSVPHPTGVVHGSRNPWDASDAICRILEILSSDATEEARDAMTRLAAHPALGSYSGKLKHLAVAQHMKRIDASHTHPGWRAAVETLANRAPASAQDLHALTLAHLNEIGRHVAHANTDPYKQFWNNDRFGKLVSPKTEELARDALLEMLRVRLSPMGLRAEPEGHMARDKRADIVVFDARTKCVIELKRECHAGLWESASTQLDRLYSRDSEASGYGIYGVFWYGMNRKSAIPNPPSGYAVPQSAEEMQRILESTLPEHLTNKIRIAVFDVSGEG